MMTIGGATKFRTPRINIKGMKQVMETVTAGHISGPTKKKENLTSQ